MRCRILRTNSEPRLDRVRGGVHTARCIQVARVSLPCADVGNAPRSPRPFRQTPLRPSEGLPVAFPSSLSPCPVDRSAAQLYGASAGRWGTRMARRQTWGPSYGPAVPTRHADKGSHRAHTDTLNREGVALVNLPAAPPANVAAEQSVLGTLIVFYKPQLVHIAQAAGLKWSDFYYQQHRLVYRAVLRLHRDGCHVDHLTVRHLLVTHQCADEQTEALLDMLAASANANGFREHARILAEDGRWRRWLEATLTALERIHERDEAGFWDAVGRVREDVLPGELRVIDGGESGERAEEDAA